MPTPKPKDTAKQLLSTPDGSLTKPDTHRYVNYADRVVAPKDPKQGGITKSNPR